MKRYCISLIAVALTLMCATAALAIFPVPDGPGSNFLLKQGWYNNTTAWYLEWNVSTNDINTARLLHSNHFSWLSPKLSSLLQPREPGGETAARPMYVVLNPGATQGPVFSAAPGQDPPDMLYSGFWQVFYIVWKPGMTPRPIINATPGDPQGLPDASEADIIPTSIVIQHPILAIGPLGGPWYPGPPSTYRMKQLRVRFDYAATKFVQIPEYLVFCRNLVTRSLRGQPVLIMDASSSDLADQIGANYAPGLLNVPDGTIDPQENDTQALYSIPNSPWLCQYPILEACPSLTDQRQRNPDFTPVLRLIELNRNIPYSTVVNNTDYVEFLLTTGGLTVANDEQRLGILFFGTEG